MLNNLQKKLSEIIKYAVAIICFIIGILAFIITVSFKIKLNDVTEICFTKIDNILFNLINVCICFSALYGFYKISDKINRKIIFAISIIISLILGFAWVNYMKFMPANDQLLMVYSADNLLNKTGDLVLRPGEYLNRYPHQLGYIIYVMVIYKIFNLRSNMLILQNLNVIYSAINGIVLYFICKELFKEEKVQKMSLLLIALFSVLFWTFFDVHIYGNVPGLMFALIAVLFTIKFLNKRKMYNLVIISISLGIAYLLKSNYQIFMLGIIFVLVFDIMKNSNIKYILGIIGIMLVVFIMKTSIYSIFEHNTNYSLNTGVPMISYIYMGIAPGGVYPPGWYTGDVEVIYNESGFDKEESAEITKPLLLDRLSYLVQHPIYTLKYFGEKLETTWLNPTFQVLWCSTPGKQLDQDEEYKEYVEERPFIESILCGTGFNVVERILDAFQILFFVSAGIGIYKFRKEEDLKFLLIPIIVIGGFVFHLIWETKAIYVIQYYYILIPFIAFGICEIFKVIEERKR